MKIWNLDETNHAPQDWKNYLAKHGYDKGTHEKFKIGQIIEFWTGCNGDIRASATIKGLNGPDIYVYNDCYWFPIQDDSARAIKAVQS